MNVGFLLRDFPIYLSMEKICCMATKIMRRCRLGIGSDCLLNSLGSFVSFHFLSLFCGMAFLTPAIERNSRRGLGVILPCSFFDRLPYFQLFDVIAVYYDNGQGAVSIALRDALDFALAKNVADYRDADPSACRLLQVADYICTVVRVSDDYDAGKQTKTHERFFGNRRSFMQSFKKQLDRKLFN